MVDRGSCNFSTKVYNIQRGGGLLSIVANNVNTPVNAGSSHDVDWTISGYMVSLADGNIIKTGLPDVVAKFDPDVGVPQVGTMASYSSRGPSQWLNYIKPEIGAPDASVSAIAGTGDGESPFGGTSGAAPMVTGSAALLKEKLLETWVGPETPAIPFMLKSLLVTNAETEIYEEPVEFFNGKLAPITRIGGGEVRVDRAAASPITLWDQFEQGMRFPHLSYGQVDVTGITEIHKRVVIHNLTNQPLTYDLSSSFRFAEDDNGAVTFIMPESVEVSARLPGHLPEGHFDVIMTIDGSKLGDWTMSSGSTGTSGDNLTANEYDGYILLDDTSTSADDEAMIHMPWMVLPRKSGQTTTDPDNLAFSGGVAEVDFTNSGVQVAGLDPFSWLAHSPQYDPIYGMGDNIAEIDIKDVAVQTYLVPAGYCSADPSFIFEFVVTTYEPYNAYPWFLPTFFIELDVDQDGFDDYEIFNWDVNFPSYGDYRNLTWVADLNAGTASAYFWFVNKTNSNVFEFLLCGEQIGMNQADLFDPMDAYVYSWDGYFSGYVGDVVDMGTISPYGERYYAAVGDVVPGATETFTIYDFGPGNNPTELGVLILTGDAALGNESITLAP
jgi:hypothetical protein